MSRRLNILEGIIALHLVKNSESSLLRNKHHADDDDDDDEDAAGLAAEAARKKRPAARVYTKKDREDALAVRPLLAVS